jgi:hypothetical protein
MTYWRRRFLALVLGLSLLALVAWAFSGAVGSTGANGASAAASHSAHTVHGRASEAGVASSGLTGSGQPSGSTGPGAVTPGTPSASADPSASPSALPSAGPPNRSGQNREVISVPAQAADVSPHALRACSPGDVVLSLFSSQDSYRPGQVPQFEVDVVSTSGGPCAFNVGSKRLALVIRANGKQVWNSADCVTGGGALATDLTRGVPTIVPISWNLQTSAPGCAGRARQAQAGRYTAAAADGHLASNPVRFTVSLSRPGAGT